MGKVKVNLASGSIFEKPLITCFKGTNGTYVILDNETNGSMGLPIICIGRLEGTTINKITDKVEWDSVKENLKTIISGTALPYVEVPESLSASDEFYTQLTLPVASFDLLKSNYHVDAPAAVEPAPVVPEPAVAPAVEPIAPAEPVTIEPVEIAPISAPEITPVEPAPVEPSVVSPIDLSAIDSTPVETPVEITPIEVPSIETPVVSEPLPPLMDTPEVAPVPEVSPIPTVEPVTPVEETPAPVEPVEITPVSVPDVTPVEPVAEVNPISIDNSVMESAPTGGKISDQDLKDMKETFMKSCETMFDALVEKFNK